MIFQAFIRFPEENLPCSLRRHKTEIRSLAEQMVCGGFTVLAATISAGRGIYSSAPNEEILVLGSCGSFRRHKVAWIWLLIAGLLEVGWAIGLKYSDGFTKLWPSIWTAAGMLLSYLALAQAMKDLPVGTAYPIWTGIGAIGTAILGIVLFNEPRTLVKILSVMLITAGIIGLRFSGNS